MTSYSIFITTDWIHLETAKQHDLHWTFKDFDLIFIFLYDIYKKKKKQQKTESDIFRNAFWWMLPEPESLLNINTSSVCFHINEILSLKITTFTNQKNH